MPLRSSSRTTSGAATRRRPARSSGAPNNSKNWLKLLNDHWIGPKNNYLCGNEITIADYFGAGLVTLGELLGCDFSPYPNVQRWLGNMKKLKSWDSVNEAFNGLREMVKGQNFVRV